MSLFARKPIAALLAEGGGHPNSLKRALGAGDLIMLAIGAVIGAGSCLYIMAGLPARAWERFAIWLAIGLGLYFMYGFRNSTLRRAAPPVPIQSE